MAEAVEFSERPFSEKMPPLVSPRIRSALASLSFTEFREEFAIPTPVDRRGLIDHEALMYQVSSFVDPSYKWKAPFFDQHHLYWTGAHYESALNVDADLATTFRNLPTNLVWEPREFHDFTHWITWPADVPEYKVMKEKVRDFRRKGFLYRLTSQIMTLQEVQNRMRPYEERSKNGETRVIYVDPVTRRSTDDISRFEERRKRFLLQLQRHYRYGLIDLSQLGSVSLKELTVDELVPVIHQSTSAEVKRVGGQAALRATVQYERAA